MTTERILESMPYVISALRGDNGRRRHERRKAKGLGPDYRERRKRIRREK